MRTEIVISKGDFVDRDSRDLVFEPVVWSYLLLGVLGFGVSLIKPTAVLT